MKSISRKAAGLAAVLGLLFFANEAFAKKQFSIEGQNEKPLFYVDAADRGERYYGGVSAWSLPPNYIGALEKSFEYWSILLGSSPKNSKPVVYNIGTVTIENAFAGSNYESDGQGMTRVGSAIVNNNFSSNASFYGYIELGTVGTAPNSKDFPDKGFFAGRPLLILPNNGDKANLSAVILHEIGHSMGILSTANNGQYFNDGGFKFFKSYNPIDGDISKGDLNNFDSHLVDSFGRQAHAGSSITIVTSDDNNGHFQIVRPAGAKMAYAYFQGEQVMNVITDGDISYGVLILDADLNPEEIEGLPIDAFEFTGDVPYLDMSHSELRNSLMSHQNYRNWATLMEAEIALLQDVGYDIDRKNFFGTSIYGNSQELTITQNFSARKDNAYIAGKPNKTDRTIGLHIYGFTNKIVMEGDVLAEGLGSIGIRVDGWQNDLDIVGDILIGGQYGTGLLVAYGKEHTIHLENSATLSATGSGGIGARFDFGDNVMGNIYEYRGSYITTVAGVPKIYGDLATELNGELITEFNIEGTIIGSAAAIYISKNAFVKEINIAQDSLIIGNIISDWDPQADFVMNGESFDTKNDLQTTINFGAKANSPDEPDPLARLKYQGAILGKASLNVVVFGGILDFSGTMVINTLTVNEDNTLNLLSHKSNGIKVNATTITFESGSTLSVDLEPVGMYSYLNPKGYNFIILNSEQGNGLDGLDIQISQQSSAQSLTLGFNDYSGYTIVSNKSVNSDASKVSYNFNIVGGQTSLHEDYVQDISIAGAPLFIALQNLAGDIVVNRANLISNKTYGFWAAPHINYSKSAGGIDYEITNSNLEKVILRQDHTISNMGFALGGDYKFTNGTFAGLALIQDLSEYKNSSTNESFLTRIAAYGGIKNYQNLDIVGFISAGAAQNVQIRSGFQRNFRSDYETSQYEAGVNVSRELKVKFIKKTIRPFIDYEFISVNAADYDEGKVSEYSLKYENEGTITHQAKLGANADFSLKTKALPKPIAIKLGAYYRGLFGNRSMKTNVSFTRDSNHETLGVDLPQSAQNAFGLDLGLNYEINANNVLTAGYGVILDTQVDNHKINFAYAYKF